jgi:kumamolisin
LRTKTIFTIAGLATASLVSAQVRQGNGILPPSSVAQPGDAGKRMHTHLIIYAPNGVIATAPTPEGLMPTTGYPGYETPASLACVYGLVPTLVSGCPVASTMEAPTGGSGLIVIVDAYDQPNAAADLATFSTVFGLPQANFSVIYAGGSQPANGCESGWAVEEDLDIEYAHAMAPNAQIVLIEAVDNSGEALYAAVNSAVSAANSYITAHGGKGEVSMSFGSDEFNGENGYDSNFAQSGVVYFASTGDDPGTEYPSVSPNIVAAGGTQVNRDSNGNYTNQTAWSDGGGGLSQYEPRPSFQSGVTSVVGANRGAPDISFDASGGSPVVIYAGCYSGFAAVYGTSVAAPSLAGIVNNTGAFNTSSNAENTAIYDNMTNIADFTDITSGSCGTNSATVGYDLCTGVGAPNGFPIKHSQTITFSKLSNQSIGIPPFAISASATSGLTVSFTSTTLPYCTVSGDMVTLVKKGECSITASQSGFPYYYAAAPVTQSFRITSGTTPQTITFAPLPDKPYSTTPITVSATASSGLTVSFASTTPATCIVSGDEVKFVTTGRCAIQATQAGSSVYEPAKPVTQSFTITALAQTITFNPLPSPVPIDTPAFTVSATASSGLAVSFASTTATTCSVSGDLVTLLAAGRCAIKATQAGDADYKPAAPVTQAFTITLVQQTITFDPLPPQTLGAQPFSISATATSGLTVSFASTTPTVCTVSVDTVTLHAAGHCSIKATQAGDATYAAAKPVIQGFQVKP